MASLHDIVPPQHRVSLPSQGAEVEVDVRGLTIQDCSDLLARHPEIVAVFDGKLDVMTILKAGPHVVAAVIAMACGAANDAAAEKIALQLSVGEQAEILAIVVKLTAPKGVGPFVALLKSLGLNLDTARSAATSAAASQKPSPISADEGTASKK